LIVDGILFLLNALAPGPCRLSAGQPVQGERLMTKIATLGAILMLVAGPALAQGRPANSSAGAASNAESNNKPTSNSAGGGGGGSGR
jgi:hypothetical protein